MVCFHPIKMYKPRYAQLDIPPRDYYALKKLSFHKSDFREEVQVACGHCLGCRLDHASMWQTRLMMEAKNWEKCCFVTLTYNNPHLPMKYGKPQLVKKDLQDFLKRLRYHYQGEEEWVNPKTGEYENPIRYYACGEYGPKGGRPHYHLAIFNWEPEDMKLYKLNKHGDPSFTSKKLQEIWGKGFCVVEELNFETAGYVARYVQKKAGIKPKKLQYTGKIFKEWKIDERNGKPFEHYRKERKIVKELQEPEFQVMSRAVGIGRKYWEENKEKIKRNNGILLKVKDKVKIKPIPRYFKKLWEDENYEEYYRWKYERQKDGVKRKLEIINKIKLNGNPTEEDILTFYLDTQERILNQKAQALKRNEFI